MSSSSVSFSKPKFIVAEVEFTSDYPNKYSQYLSAHMIHQRAHAASNGGKIVLCGPLVDGQKEPSPGAAKGGMAIWRDATEEEIVKFIQADPFFEHGLVKQWTLRPWIPLLGHKVFEDDFVSERKN
jgi:uncharacterized protein YciI